MLIFANTLLIFAKNLEILLIYEFRLSTELWFVSQPIYNILKIKALRA